MRTFLTSLCLAALMLAAGACTEKFETSVKLGVDHEQLNLPSSEAGYFYFHITSNTSWKITVDPDDGWLRTDKRSGKGIAYPKFTYDENTEPEGRQTSIVVTAGKTVRRVLVVQPNAN